MIKKLTSRRDLTYARLNDIPGISLVAPEGAFYAFARLHNVTNDTHWVTELMRATGVVVVPGSGFGQRPGTAHFRVVFLPPEAILSAAYDKIKEFHASYKNPA